MNGPAPAVAAIRSALREYLADLPPGSLILVACSGGADSLALAAGTAFVAPRLGLRAGAVLVDHGWFPGSAQVISTAADTCRKLGLAPVEPVTAGPAPTGCGPEAAARAIRYAALDEVAARTGAVAVLLGHTRDDQAESVLLGLARGSGARSLSGMAAVRGRYRRPLLAVPRAQTRAACEALGLTPWQDPANQDPAYARSRVRALLPDLEAALGPGVIAALARTAALLRDDAEALDAAAGELLAAAGVPPAGLASEATWAVGVLAGAPVAVRRRALLLAARHAGSPAGALSQRHALALDALVTRWAGQGPVALPGGVVGRRACGRLTLAASARQLPDAEPERE